MPVASANRKALFHFESCRRQTPRRAPWCGPVSVRPRCRAPWCGLIVRSRGAVSSCGPVAVGRDAWPPGLPARAAAPHGAVRGLVSRALARPVAPAPTAPLRPTAITPAHYTPPLRTRTIENPRNRLRWLTSGRHRPWGLPTLPTPAFTLSAGGLSIGKIGKKRATIGTRLRSVRPLTELLGRRLPFA